MPKYLTKLEKVVFTAVPSDEEDTLFDEVPVKSITEHAYAVDAFEVEIEQKDYNGIERLRKIVILKVEEDEEDEDFTEAQVEEAFQSAYKYFDTKMSKSE